MRVRTASSARLDPIPTLRALSHRYQLAEAGPLRTMDSLIEDLAGDQLLGVRLLYASIKLPYS